jgi:hypothetical protein
MIVSDVPRHKSLCRIIPRGRRGGPVGRKAPGERGSGPPGGGGDAESRESDDLLITWLAGVLAGAMGG